MSVSTRANRSCCSGRNTHPHHVLYFMVAQVLLTLLLSRSQIGLSFLQNILSDLGICWVALEHFVADINSINKTAGFQVVECKLVANGG